MTAHTQDDHRGRSNLDLQVQGLKEGKFDGKITCGVFEAPFSAQNRCNNLATRKLTIESFLKYKAYRRRWNRVFSLNETPSVLPLVNTRPICETHRKALRNLPDIETERSKA